MLDAFPSVTAVGSSSNVDSTNEGVLSIEYSLEAREESELFGSGTVAPPSLPLPVYRRLMPGS